MKTEQRIALLLSANTEKLDAIDSILQESGPHTPRPSLRLFRMGEAARETGLSRQTLWRAIHEGRLQSVTVRERSHRIPETALLRFVGAMP